jgi:RHS repeat-associated protein
MNLSKRLGMWWLRGGHPWDALLAANERGIGSLLACLRGGVRRARALAARRRFIPTVEQFEVRYCPAAPVLTGVGPALGPIAGGAAVTLTGSGFTGATAVYFGNGQPAAFSVVSDTSIRATSPAEHVGVVDITVVNGSGASATTTADEYTYTDLPSIRALSPKQGPMSGGASVTITGTNLHTAMAVSFGGTPATTFTISKGQLTAIAPAHAAGTVDVQVTTASGTTALTDADKYTYALPVPTVSGVSPNTGLTHGGQVVTITGTDLTGATRVSFGGTPAATFTVTSATQLTATAPPEAAGTVDVTVTTPGGSSAPLTVDQFTYSVPVPVVSSVNPSKASTDGGQVVTIAGSDLSGASAVVFGSVPAESFTVVGASEITATAPAESAGTVDVRVTTAGGQSAVASNDQLTYAVPAPAITGLTPASGSTAGGDIITITGTNLAGASAVSFGSAPAVSFVQVSDTQIAARAPAAAPGSVDVRVTTGAGKSAAVSADQFKYVAPVPTVTGVTPASGLTTGGQTVALWGTNFTGVSQVFFGGSPASSFTIVSATEITATAPAQKAGLIDITVTGAGGPSAVSSLDQYTYTAPAPVVSGLSPASGSAAGGTVVTISGANLAGATQVTFGSAAAISFAVVSATAITAQAPAHAVGTFDVSVTTASGTSTVSNADEFTFVTPLPVVTGLSTSTGPTAGGTTVVITGTDLTGATKVLFGGTAAKAFHVDSPTQITATAPAQAAGTVAITVTTPGGTSATSAAASFVYAEPPPVISGLSVPIGSSGGGDTVTISGVNFTGATQVSFGTAAATSFTVDSASQITAIAPAGSVGSVDVSVTTPAGTTTPSPADAFNYVLIAPAVTGVSPLLGSTAGGTSITITGTDLTGATQVLFGSTPATSFTVDSATEITAVAPAAAVGVSDVTVTTAGGTSLAAGQDQFSYVVGNPASIGAAPGAAMLAKGAAASGAAPATSSSSGTASAVTLPADDSSGDSAAPPPGPTTVVVSTGSDHPTTSSTDDGSGGGSYTYNDTWSNHYQVTVTDNGVVVSSYTYNSGGTYYYFTSWSTDSNGNTSGTSTTRVSNWSNDNYSQNSTSPSGTGTKGVDWTSGTTTYKNSGSDHSHDHSDVTSTYGPGTSKAHGTSSYGGGGSSTYSNTGNGSYSYAVPGGGYAGTWKNGDSASNFYADQGTGSLGADGVWVATGSMSNHGFGTSYSSLKGGGGYTLTSPTPTSSNNSTTTSKDFAKTHDHNSYGNSDTLAAGVWKSVTGYQTGTTTHSNTSSAHTNGNDTYTIAGGKVTGSWTAKNTDNPTGSSNTSTTLGSGGIWVSTGSMSLGDTAGGKTFATSKTQENINAGSKPTSWEDGTAQADTTSHNKWASQSKSKDTLGTAGWVQTSGTTSHNDTASETGNSGGAGGYGYTVAGGAVTGTWSDGSEGMAKSVSNTKGTFTAGAWVPSGTANWGDSGFGNSSYSGKGSYTVASGSSGLGSWDAGSVTLTEGGGEESHYYGGALQKLGTGGWQSVGGGSYSAETRSSRSGSAGKGTYGYTVGGGKVTGTWSNSDGISASYTSKAGGSGSDGVWVSTGSLTVGNYEYGNSSYAGSGGYPVKSSGSGGGLSSRQGNETLTESGNDNWGTNDVQTTTLAADGTWQLTSGTNTQGSGGSSVSAYKGSGTYQYVFVGGSMNGTWTDSGGANNSDNSAQSIVVAGGAWVATGLGSSSESDGTNATSSYTGKGTDTLSGSGNTGSITLTESGGDKSSYKHHLGNALTVGGGSRATGGGTTQTNGNSSASGSVGNGGYTNDGGAVHGTWISGDSSSFNTSNSNTNSLGSDGIWVATGSTSVISSSSSNESYNGKGGNASGTNTSGGTSGSSASAANVNTLAAGVWTQVSGKDMTGNKNSSHESYNDGGPYNDGAVGGTWTASGGANASYKYTEKSTLGVGGLWTATGTEKTSSGGHSNTSYKGTGAPPVTGSGVTGSISVKQSGSTNSKYGDSGEQTLTKSGAWQAATGSSHGSSGSSSTSTSHGSGKLGSTVASGASHGTWGEHANEGSNFSENTKSTLGSAGVWVTTGSMTVGASSGSGSNFSDTGNYTINDVGGSGSWTTGNVTTTEGGTSSATSNEHAKYSIGADGNWDAASGGGTSMDKGSGSVSIKGGGDDGSAIPGGSENGTWSINDGDTATEGDSSTATLGADGTWVVTTAPPYSTNTPTDPYTVTFNATVAGANGTPTTLSGGWTLASAYVSTTTGSGAPVVSGFTETVTGGFTANGVQASFGIALTGTPSDPTTTITQTNTTALSGLSVSGANLGSLAAQVTSALTSTAILAAGSGGAASSAVGTTYTDVLNGDGEVLSETITDNSTGAVTDAYSRTYDDAGNMLTQTDGSGRTTAWTYNAANQVTSETVAYGTPQAATTTFAYDANGNLLSVTDPDNNTTSYTYNAQGEETSMTDPLGNTETKTYNDASQLIAQTNRDGLSEDYTYAPAGQVATETWYAADGVTVTDQFIFTYNTANQLVSASNDEGTYTFTYDDQGRVSGVTEPFGVSLSFGYDANGNRDLVQDSFGGTTQSTYDAANQLVSELFSQTGQPSLQVDQTYNAAGAVAGQTDSTNGEVIATAADSYDASGNLTDLLYQAGNGTTLADFQYAYAPGAVVGVVGSGGVSDLGNISGGSTSGDLLAETDNGVTTGYQYDTTGQLTSYGSTTQTYDANGNRNGPGYVVGPDNQLLSDGTNNYTYDADGNETTRTNIATGDTWTYGYDNANQMISAVETAADGTVEVQAAFKYDAFGNRLEQDVTYPGQPTVVQRYAYDAWNPNTPSGVGTENANVWADLNGNNQLQTRYIHGDALDQLFARMQYDPSGTATPYWYVTDHLGSVRDVLDGSGNVVDAINYDAYGNITSETNPADRGRYAWTGRELDAETGLQYNRARYYDATTARWMSQDPLGLDAGDSNLYRYVQNRPTGETDPSGLLPPVERLMGDREIEMLLAAKAAEYNQLKSKFMKWYSEQQDMTWLKNVPEPPPSLHFINTEPRSLLGTGVAIPNGWVPDSNIAMNLLGYHPNATYGIRSIPKAGSLSGAQAMYDANRKLITGGLSAGSADMVSPRSFYDPEHIKQDVAPFDDAKRLDLYYGGQKYRDLYQKVRPPNTGSAPKNIVN